MFIRRCHSHGIPLKALAKDGWLLKHMEQTPERCMIAVKQNGLVIQIVKNQTPELCAEAIKQNSRAIQYIRYSPKTRVLNKYKEPKTVYFSNPQVLSNSRQEYDNILNKARYDSPENQADREVVYTYVGFACFVGVIGAVSFCILR